MLITLRRFTLIRVRSSRCQELMYTKSSPVGNGPRWLFVPPRPCRLLRDHPPLRRRQLFSPRLAALQPALTPSLNRRRVWPFRPLVRDLPRRHIEDQLGELVRVTRALGLLRHGPSMPRRVNAFTT